MTPTERAKRVADAIEWATVWHTGNGNMAHSTAFGDCNNADCVLANELLRLNSDYTRWWPNPTTQQIIEHLEAGGRVEHRNFDGWSQDATTMAGWKTYLSSGLAANHRPWPYIRLVLAPPPPATEWVPLHEVIGRRVAGERELTVWQYRVRGATNTTYEWADNALSQPQNGWHPLTVVDGKVEVLTEGAES